VADGHFAFSIERAEIAHYALFASVRFAHRSRCIEDVLNRSRGLFAVEKSITTQIRLDAVRPVVVVMMFIIRK
jgi:predicted TPR repeat methyltransferase